MKIILEALKKLDPANPEHWTQHGTPRMDVMRDLTGNQDLERKAITDAAPLFTKDNPVLPESTSSQAPPTINEDEAPTVSGVSDDGEVMVPEASLEAPTEAPEAPLAPEEAELEARITAGHSRISALRGQMDGLQREIQLEEANIERLVNQRRQPQPHDNQMAIMGYIESQKKLRAERAKRFAQVRALGLDALNAGPAPIDVAMRKNTSRGQSRPMFPLPVKV